MRVVKPVTLKRNAALLLAAARRIAADPRAFVEALNALSEPRLEQEGHHVDRG